ncbi:phosphoesterase [Streptococcus pneumoniae]|nr:phosphoesterase [Streptococcus pneumoniae]
MKNYPIYDIHPHILHGVEISAADKLHIVCIYDYEQESWVNQWLSENIISEKDGSYQHSLTIMKDFNNQKIVNYIAHFNSYNILKKGSHLSGAYKRKIFSKENTRFMYCPQKVRQIIYPKDLVLYCTGLSPFSFTLIRLLL